MADTWSSGASSPGWMCPNESSGGTSLRGCGSRSDAGACHTACELRVTGEKCLGIFPLNGITNLALDHGRVGDRFRGEMIVGVQIHLPDELTGSGNRL